MTNQRNHDLRRIALLGLAALLAGLAWTAVRAGEPTNGGSGAWVNEKGKSEGWLKGTEKIRDLLGKIKHEDPLVKKWTPAIKRRCRTLMKLRSFGKWEHHIFGYIFEAMLEDLVAGKPPLTRFAGQTIAYGYWSDHIQKLTGSRITIPPDYDPEKEYQLFMYYKLGGGLYWRSPKKKYAQPWDEGAKVMATYQPKLAACQKTPGTFHAWSALYYGVKGRMGVDVEFVEMTKGLTQDFAISADRIFLSGFSDGGFTSMWLASRYPHRVAGIAPEVANWQYGNTNQIGLYNVAVLVVDGWRDGGYVGENFCRFLTLNNMGYDIQGIFGHHGHAATPYETEATMKQIMDWARTRRLNRNPKRVRYATWNLSWHRAFWFSIERMANPSLAAVVDAEIKDGNRIEVKAKNIAVYKLLLNEKLVDSAKKVTVVTNGKESYAGDFKPELTVEHVKLPESAFVKSPRMPGGLIAQITRATYTNKKANLKPFRLPGNSWLHVKPTGGSEEARKALGAKLPTWYRPDKAVTEKDLAKYSLILIGGPGLNTLADKFADKLPIKFEEGKFTIGTKVYDKPEHCVKLIHPNPLNPKKYVILLAFNDAAAALRSGAAGKSFFSVTAWGFREGDCQVFGVKDPDNTYGSAISSRKQADYYVLDSNWKAPDQTVLGTLERDFDFPAVLRLKADAIREALDADVGIMAPPPGYLKWKCWLRKGPVTLNDIASTHSLPEFVMSCEVTGAQLKGLVKSYPSCTVLKSKSDPGYDPKATLVLSEIEDGKTYKLASGYGPCDSGSLGYGVTVEKMPKPHFYFKDVKAFAAQEGAALRSKNLVQTDIEVNDAVASYIKKRGKLAPRPVSGNLIQYVSNPTINEYPALDWVHVAVRYALKEAKSGKPLKRRMSLGIGLAAKDSKGDGGDDSKHMAAIDAYSPEGKLEFDMATLEKKLGVKVTATTAAFGISGDAGNPGGDSPVALVAPGEAKCGEIQLVKLRLVNSGNKDLSGKLVLTSPAMTRINGGIFPKSAKTHFRGYVKDIGPRKKAYQSCGAVVLCKSPFPKEQALVIPSGYNHGRIGSATPLSLKAGETLDLPIVCVSVRAADLKKPKLNLTGVLNTLRPALMKELAK